MEIAVAENDGTIEITPESWEGKGLSAAEILASLTGIQHYRQGGVGSFQTVSIRGIAARSVVVCVDGIPLNDGAGGAVDLGSIDMNQISKIEVYKDYVPARFGSSGVGGAVNFITKGSNFTEVGNSKVATGRVLASYGSHGSWEGALQIQSRITDSTSLSASIATRHSDNDYEFENRNGTPYNSQDDFTDKRRNAEFTEHSGLFRLRTLHGNGVFSSLSASVNYAEGGNPGREDFQTMVAGYEGLLSLVSYSAELPQLFGWLWLEMGATGKFARNESHSFYPLDHIGNVSSEYLEYGAQGYALVPEISGTYNGEWVDGNVTVVGSADYLESCGNSRDWNLMRLKAIPSGEISFKAGRRVALGASGLAQVVWDDIQGGDFVLPTASVRLESAASRDVSYSGRLFSRIGWEYFGGNISLGRYFREPQLMELYGVYPGMISNPNLVEENATRMEAGAFIKSPSKMTKLSLTYYESRLENGIVWLVSGSFMKPDNIGEAHIRGLEAELSSDPARYLTLTLRATFQDAVDRSDSKIYYGKKLPGEPARSYLAEATVRLPYHLDFTWASDFRTKIYSDRANRMEQKAADHHRVAVGFTPFEKTRLMFSIDNLTNETYRNIYTPYPTPGREYKLTIIQGI